MAGSDLDRMSGRWTPGRLFESDWTRMRRRRRMPARISYVWGCCAGAAAERGEPRLELLRGAGAPANTRSKLQFVFPRGSKLLQNVYGLVSYGVINSSGDGALGSPRVTDEVCELNRHTWNFVDVDCYYWTEGCASSTCRTSICRL